MIGLVTCFWVKNYGSALQSYATQNILDQLNVENETINYSVSNEPFLRRLNIILHKLRYPRACLKNKSCTKHIFPRPFS